MVQEIWPPTTPGRMICKCQSFLYLVKTLNPQGLGVSVLGFPNPGVNLEGPIPNSNPQLEWAAHKELKLSYLILGISGISQMLAFPYDKSWVQMRRHTGVLWQSLIGTTEKHGI